MSAAKVMVQVRCGTISVSIKRNLNRIRVSAAAPLPSNPNPVQPSEPYRESVLEEFSSPSTNIDNKRDKLRVSEENKEKEKARIIMDKDKCEK